MILLLLLLLLLPAVLVGVFCSRQIVQGNRARHEIKRDERSANAAIDLWITLDDVPAASRADALAERFDAKTIESEAREGQDHGIAVLLNSLDAAQSLRVSVPQPESSIHHQEMSRCVI